jgi:uncharacterized membrane protein YecN with MAPEG domain
MKHNIEYLILLVGILFVFIGVLDRWVFKKKSERRRIYERFRTYCWLNILFQIVARLLFFSCSNRFFDLFHCDFEKATGSTIGL